MSYPTIGSGFCTDEDIARRAEADFLLLTPSSQQIAYGADGSFASTDLWTLASPSVNFKAQGTLPGMIVALTKPTANYKSPGTLFAIDSLPTVGSATLRRIGLGTGIGQPPAPLGGLSGVEFRIVTLQPQIVAATFSLYKRFGLDPNIPWKSPTNLYDPAEVVEACVLQVLKRQYEASSRERGDTFWEKARLYDQDLNAVLDRIDEE